MKKSKKLIILICWMVFNSIPVCASPFCTSYFNKELKVSLRERLQFLNPIRFPRMINAIELLGQNFYQPSKRGAIVGISGIEGFRADINREVGDYVTGKPFHNGKNVFHYRAWSPRSIIDQLLHAYSIAGPIYRLVILGHGSPGSITIGSGEFNKYFARSYKPIIEQLPDDLFVQDAEIVLLSCNCIQGNILRPNGSVNDIKNIFSMFVRNGAKIAATRQAVRGNLQGFIQTEGVIKITESVDSRVNNMKWRELAVVVPITLAYIPFLWMENATDILWRDYKSKYGRVEIIDLPPTIPQENN